MIWWKKGSSIKSWIGTKVRIPFLISRSTSSRKRIWWFKRDEIGCSRSGTPSAQMISIISSIHLPGAQILLELILNLLGNPHTKTCIPPPWSHFVSKVYRHRSWWSHREQQASFSWPFADANKGGAANSNQCQKVPPISLQDHYTGEPQMACGIQAMRILGDWETNGKCLTQNQTVFLRAKVHKTSWSIYVHAIVLLFVVSVIIRFVHGHTLTAKSMG